MSVWQACQGFDLAVLSIGSEQANRDAVARIAPLFQRVLVWCDDKDKTRSLMQLLGDRAVGMQSPKIDGPKLDANALLQRGLLRALLELKLKQRQPVTAPGSD